MSLSVLLSLHHRVKPGFGAPGVTLTLGDALAAAGCRVEYFGFDQAFGTDTTDSVASGIKFPWKLSSFLKKRAGDFDVIDASEGDAWVWARRRPGDRNSAALVTRSHGLEHAIDRWQRADAKAGNVSLSWKYPFYHGGYRLWEVRQSLGRSDHVLLLNESDRRLAVNELGVAADRASVVLHGIGDHFLGQPQPTPAAPSAPIKLAFVGTWIDRKGKRTVVETAAKLQAAGIKFELTLLGTGFDDAGVLADFPHAVRPLLRLQQKYRNDELPSLLRGNDVLLMLSFTEGYPLSLPEGMSSGLAAVATRVGAAPVVIKPGENGELVDPGDAAAVAAAITRWSKNPDALLAARRAAHASMQDQGWKQVAARTIAVYEQALRRRRAAAPVAKPDAAVSSADGHRPTLSICICTANRPAVLRRCLASIEQGEELPTEVLVGDDSIDGTVTAAVCNEFDFVRYIHGPRQGLCANRNVVIAAARCEYLSLLDDDAEATPTFVRLARDIAAASDGRTLFTGDILEQGVTLITPYNPSFWGHFSQPFSAEKPNQSIQLNSNLFPRSALATARFDEKIVYGYEDMDLCQQILAGGHKIEYRPELINLHLPPPKTEQTKQSQQRMAERARYYTSLKRYWLWQRRPLAAGVYVAAAPVREAIHQLKHLHLKDAIRGFFDIGWALKRVWVHQHTTILPPRKNADLPRVHA